MNSRLSLIKNKLNGRLYIIPYVIIIIIGIWYRAHNWGVAVLHGDSGNYLIPPFLKKITGEWYKGERPLPYLKFIYYTLDQHKGLKYTIITQQTLGIATIIMVCISWFLFLRKLKIHPLIGHFWGCIMIAIYVSSPIIMYYEQLIGPEAISMFLMGLLILLLMLIYNEKTNNLFIIGAAVFINLYISSPMPKVIFASFIIEILLIITIIRNKNIKIPTKIITALIPHILYVLVVTIPEHNHDINKKNEDRTFIEFKQMTYTHFDILIKDKSNFNVSSALQDSLVIYYEQAQKHQPKFLIGFSSDYLMWGKASDGIDQYYMENHDSIANFYKQCTQKLFYKYPFELATSIGKQIFCFYVPNSHINKDLHYDPNLQAVYQGSIDLVKKFDQNLNIQLKYNHHRPNDYTSLEAVFPKNMEEAHAKDYMDLPLLVSDNFVFNKWFDQIFLLAMLTFIVLNIINYKKYILDIISILYIIIFVYVTTIAIIHSFDITRFTTTIYPYIIFVTFICIVDIFSKITNMLHTHGSKNTN